MMEKPVIGILASRFATEGNGCGRHFVNDTYVGSVVRTGGLPVMIPIVDSDEDQERLLAMCDGIMVPGGHDLNPLIYGEEPDRLLGEGSLRYDRYQIAMVKKAYLHQLPLLGICRGHQVLNVAAGGTLYQDVTRQKPEPVIQHAQVEKDRGEVSHYISISEGSRLYWLFGGHMAVNSFHHQAVKELGEGFAVTARASDGTVEAIEREGEPFCVGVQWHPEVMFEAGEAMRPLFQAFADAAAQRRGMAAINYNL